MPPEVSLFFSILLIVAMVALLFLFFGWGLWYLILRSNLRNDPIINQCLLFIIKFLQFE